MSSQGSINYTSRHGLMRGISAIAQMATMGLELTDASVLQRGQHARVWRDAALQRTSRV